MKKLFQSLLYLGIFCSSFSGQYCIAETPAPVPTPNLDEFYVENELTAIDRLCKATEENLEHQKKLRTLIQEYKKIEGKCVDRPTDNDLLYKLAMQGGTVYDAIEGDYLADYFKPEFIAELKKLKEIADKKNIPQIQ